MKRIRELLSFRRRNSLRVAVNFMVDVELPETDPPSAVGLFALDVSAQGIRLKGGDVKQVQRLLSPDGSASMGLRMPGVRWPLPRVQAELKWSDDQGSDYLTGWRFIGFDSGTERIIVGYISEHQDDVIEE